MLVVKEVKSNKEQREFLNFPLQLYKDCPYFVPPLYGDEKKIFSKNYVYYETSEAVYYNAYLDGKIVGRISAILQKASNEKWGQKRVRFTRFDCIDNQDVANSLFDAVVNYAKEKNMDEIVGPLGFSDLEREGLLVEGFDQLSTFEEQYNYDYYPKLIENYGFEKEIDWLEHKLKLKENDTDRIERLSALMLKRFKLKLVKTKSINDFIKRYADQFYHIIDVTYAHIYGTVPLTDKVKKMLTDNFKLIVNKKYVSVIVDENDRVVCAAVCFPSIGKALQPSKGHLTPLALIRLLKALKKPEVIDLALIGVLPEYAMKGVSTAFLGIFKDILKEPNIKYAETNLNLETNHNIINQWKNFDAVQHKRRRSYIKKI